MSAVGQPSKLVMVVEDNASAREGIADTLRGEGFAVSTAADGQEALLRLGAGPLPDLILLDMLLPVLDGWHFLKAIQAQQQLAGVPVVVTTGTILTREWAADHGCAGLLRKPLDPELLLVEIRRCLGEPPPA